MIQGKYGLVFDEKHAGSGQVCHTFSSTGTSGSSPRNSPHVQAI